MKINGRSLVKAIAVRALAAVLPLILALIAVNVIFLSSLSAGQRGDADQSPDVAQSETEQAAATGGSTSAVIVTCIAVTIFAGALASFLFSLKTTIVSPIQKLTGMIDEASSNDLPTVTIPPHAPREIQDLYLSCGALIREIENLKPVGGEKLPQVFTRAVGACDKHTDTNDNEEIRQSALVTAVKKYVSDNISKEISRSDIAKHVGFSPDHLTRQFKRETGSTLNRYINTVRIETAKKLLLQSNLSVSTIAECTGFESVAYFSSMFRQLNGVTPREFRKGSGT